MADIELSVGLQANSLTEQIQREVNKASNKKVKVQIDVEANKNSFKDSLGKIKSVKIDVGVNKTTFNQSVREAINGASEHVKTKLKIDVDEAYLRRQLNAALKGKGTANLNKDVLGKTSELSDNTDAQRLKEIEQQARLTTRAYNELNKARNAVRSAPRGSDEVAGLEKNADTLSRYLEGFKNGTVSAEKFREELAKIGGSNAEYINSLKESDQYANSFSDKMQRFKMHLTTLTSIVRGFQMVRMVVQPLVNAVTEVDTAMTQLRIVTNASNADMEQYANSIMNVADKTAGSVKDLVNSTTTFARLGYTLDQSADLAKYTQMLENVGDIDEAAATSAITAIVKAYNVSADDLESVMDKLVETGNHFPISVAELAEGMNNAGSMLAMATGGDLEESLALLTAANTTTQNISKSSTGLRTIAARIRNVGTELDDLGETMTDVEYDAVVKALTDNSVALTDEYGQLRDVYDILSDLSKVWVTMSDNEQAALAKTLSGTRQQN